MTDILTRAKAKQYVGDCLVQQGKLVDANSAYMACVLNYSWDLSSVTTNEQCVIWQSVKKINRKQITVVDYKAFLENAKKNTEVLPASAKFVGYLADQIGK